MECCGDVWCWTVEADNELPSYTLEVCSEKGGEVIAKVVTVWEMEYRCRCVSVEGKGSHGNPPHLGVKRECLFE